MTDQLRVFPYPVLDAGNQSFPEGEFEHDMVPGPSRNAVTVIHSLQRCKLLQQWIEVGQASYACVVSVPITGYRCLHLSCQPTQLVEWPDEQLGEPPYFRPLIVTNQDIEVTLGELADVHPTWVGHKINVQKGAKIGFGAFYRLASSLQQLLSIIRNPDLEKGTFRVRPCTQDGYYFQVHVADALFWFLQNPKTWNEHRRSILTHIVSTSLGILRRDFAPSTGREGQWRDYANLVALSQEMESKQLLLWDDPDFSSEYAATNLYPHLAPRAYTAVEEE